MGNSLPRRATGGAATCRVILADCTVVAMEEGATVAELMLEHPQQFVVELRSFLAGNRAALPADQQLEVGKEEKKAAAGPPELPFSELGNSPALTGRQHHSARFTRAWRPSLHTIEERAAGGSSPLALLTSSTSTEKMKIPHGISCLYIFFNAISAP
ncbi:unnamed protein product [Spirodela intermedia]|uniref:Uncharacterized protein n=1 Tax=Spirodela intermedia TaxID=51605 RepID=A0A7I8IXV7_SPIIN|nr:unnamed protein product [Spirodela intermedia]CAA6661992.1 unnamed protein product [Spirodela intermedia]